MSKRSIIILLLLLPMLAVSSARFSLPWLIRRGDTTLLALTEYIDARLQPGDIVYHVGDGSWVNMINYTAYPQLQYKMPLCAPGRGYLSPVTRGGLGMQIAPLEQIQWTRAWIITAVSPMTPDCEQWVINRWLKGQTPVSCINNDIIKSDCLYLITRP